MFKQMCLWAACLATGSLTAELIGDVEIQFPPSNYEWKVLGSFAIDHSFSDDEDLISSEEEETVGDETEDCKVDYTFYTHREGDALELFTAIEFRFTKDEEDQEEETLELVQNLLDQAINQFLPNHKFIVNRYTDLGEQEGFLSFELFDGTQDIAHGYIRGFNDAAKERSVGLFYLTTAPKSELNEMVWTEVLNQARFVN